MTRSKPILAMAIAVALSLGAFPGGISAQAPDSSKAGEAPAVQQATPSQPTEDKTVIVVTGTFEPAPLEEVNRSVEVIPVLDTAPLHHYWTEALQSDASVDLRQRGQNGIQGDLSIRGSTFGQTLILLDGLRVNDAQTAHHNLDVPIP